MQSMQGKCLKTKPKHEAQFPSNPQNFSHIGIHYQNGQKGLEGQYSESFSSRCAWPPKKVKTHAQIQRKKVEGNQTILRIKRLQTK
jgi:hypothetical protein